jgi:hypothetical protein
VYGTSVPAVVEIAVSTYVLFVRSSEAAGTWLVVIFWLPRATVEVAPV